MNRISDNAVLCGLLRGGHDGGAKPNAAFRIRANPPGDDQSRTAGCADCSGCGIGRGSLRVATWRAAPELRGAPLPPPPAPPPPPPGALPGLTTGSGRTLASVDPEAAARDERLYRASRGGTPC